MLTWDDEVKPTSPATSTSGSYNNANREAAFSPEVSLATVASTTPRVLNDAALAPLHSPLAPIRTASAEPATSRRVQAADKLSLIHI